MNYSEQYDLLMKANTFPVELIHRNLTFSKYLECCKQKHNKTLKDLKRDTNIERGYLYQIVSGHRTPGKDKVLQLAFALELDLEETNTLLLLTNNTPLHPIISRDMFFIFSIAHNYSIEDVNNLLAEYGFEILK